MIEGVRMAVAKKEPDETEGHWRGKASLTLGSRFIQRVKKQEEWPETSEPQQWELNDRQVTVSKF